MWTPGVIRGSAKTGQIFRKLALGLVDARRKAGKAPVDMLLRHFSQAWWSPCPPHKANFFHAQVCPPASFRELSARNCVNSLPLPLVWSGPHAFPPVGEPEPAICRF